MTAAGPAISAKSRWLDAPVAIPSLEVRPQGRRMNMASVRRGMPLITAPPRGSESPIRTREVSYFGPKKTGQNWLTICRADAYIPVPARRPLTARLRASEAPHWNGETVSDRIRVRGLRRLSRPTGEWGPPWSPGCLKSESEERETRTARSLRAALSWRSNSSGRAALEETSAV